VGEPWGTSQDVIDKNKSHGGLHDDTSNFQ
jgi:hypothetical protein